MLLDYYYSFFQICRKQNKKKFYMISITKPCVVKAPGLSKFYGTRLLIYISLKHESHVGAWLLIGQFAYHLTHTHTEYMNDPINFRSKTKKNCTRREQGSQISLE